MTLPHRFLADVAAIRADRDLGAAELADLALAALGRLPDAVDVEAAVAAVAQTRPTMTPLGDGATRWADRVRDGATPGAAAGSVQREREAALTVLVDHAASLLAGAETVATLSWSSTVLAALRAAGVPRALVLESRPGLEGRRTAEALRQTGVEAVLVTDAQAPDAAEEADHILFGADATTPGGDVLNKTGTRMLALAARDAGTPTACLAGTEKLTRRFGDREPRDGSAVWSEHPDWCRDLAFETVPARLVDRFVTEHGVGTAADLAKWWVPVEARRRRWGL